MDVLNVRKRLHRWFELRGSVSLGTINRPISARRTGITVVPCNSSTHGNQITTYTVTRSGYVGTRCTYRDTHALIDAELDGTECGEAISITVGKMTEEQYEQLPEFEGW